MNETNLQDLPGEKISLVIVFFNAELYLERAFKSFSEFLNQDIQVVVVNDGSTDSSDEIIEKWRHQINFDYYELSENKGTSYARQHGIEQCNHDVIMFMDADDEYIQNPFIEVSLAFEDSHIDAIYYRSQNEYGDVDLEFQLNEISGENFFQRMLMAGEFLYPFWRYAFRKKLFYPRVLTLDYQLFEDSFSTPIIVLKAKTIKLINSVYYKHYVNIPSSAVNTHLISHSNMDGRFIDKKINIYIDRINHIDNTLTDNITDINQKYLHRFFIQTMIGLMSIDPKLTLKEYKQHLKRIQFKRPRIQLNHRIAFKNKNFITNLTLYVFGFYITSLIYKYYVLLNKKKEVLWVKER